MRIVYILRSKYGVSGGATSFYYPLIISKKNKVLVLESNKKSNEPVFMKSNKVVIHDIHAITMHEQIYNVYKELKIFKPDIIHIFQNPLSLHYVYYLKTCFPNSKWIIDYRSPHIGNKDSLKITRNFFLQFYVDQIMTHSMSSLKTNLPLRFKRALEFPPGVDLKLFLNNTYTPVKSIRKFIFIGSIHKARKLDFLVSVFGDVAKLNQHEITLDIFGEGNDFENLKGLIKDNNLSKYITLKGQLSQDKLFKIIPEYDAGIAYVPYEFFNTAPSLKSLEYAASKINIIASDTLGHKEYNKTYGFNFKLFENTAESFKTILDDVVQHGFSNGHVVKNFKAVERFDWKYIVEKKLQNVYKKILNQ